MSLSITFKKCISPNNKVDKEFESDTASFSIVLKENTDIFKPTFIIQTSSDLWRYNYVDAESSFGRYYFIVDIRSIGNNRYEVDCKTDVLYTWADEIRSNRAVIKRQERLYNLYLDDPDFHVLNYEKIQTLQFNIVGGGFMKALQYVLVTNGAGTANAKKDSSQLEKEVNIDGFSS